MSFGNEPLPGIWETTSWMVQAEDIPTHSLPVETQHGDQLKSDTSPTRN